MSVCLAFLWAIEARADLVARSRNSVVFVESNRAGEEWEAFRIVDPRHPAIYRVEGPGRVLFRVRTLPKAEPVDAIAAVLEDEQVTLTMRVPATPDPRARLSDGGSAPSMAKLFLLEVGAGGARITVRHSEGPALLVAARFAPPLEAADTAAGLPLVAPRVEPPPEVPRVGALARGDGPLAAGPEAPTPEAREIQPPLPDGDAAPEDARPEAPEPRPRPSRTSTPAVNAPPGLADHPAFDGRLDLDARPGGRGARITVEVRGGAQLDRLVRRPGVTAGVDVRGALFPGADPRAFSLGASLDVGYAAADEVVRLGGAPVDVAEVRHVYGVLTADLRARLFAREGVVAVYTSLGGGVLLGRATVRTEAHDGGAGSSGFVGAARLGATLGSAGGRPFLEVRAVAGRVTSSALRSGPAAAPGSAVTWFSAAAVVGWRFEIGFDRDDARPRASRAAELR